MLPHTTRTETGNQTHVVWASEVTEATAVVAGVTAGAAVVVTGSTGDVVVGKAVGKAGPPPPPARGRPATVGTADCEGANDTVGAVDGDVDTEGNSVGMELTEGAGEMDGCAETEGACETEGTSVGV